MPLLVLEREEREKLVISIIYFSIKHNDNYSLNVNSLFSFFLHHPLITSNGVSEWKIILRAILGLNNRANIFLL